MSAISVLRGKDVVVTKNATTIAKQTNGQLTLTSNLEDASTKDDAEGWDKQEITTRSWSVQCDNLVSPNGSEAEALLKAWIDQADSSLPTISIKFGASGSVSGTCILSQLDIDATVKQNVSVSATYTGVGACK